MSHHIFLPFSFVEVENINTKPAIVVKEIIFICAAVTLATR